MTARWLPATEEELAAALHDGRLDEGPHLDFKRELPAGRRSNVELARDLAMFANDGGTIVFGVAEPDTGRFVLAPLALQGLRERIEQVATSRLDPPLHVTVRTIATEADPTTGYLLVHVPASSGAPHMVDDRYFGRAGTTRTTLSDPQVRAVLTRRLSAQQPIHDLLDADIERDPIPADLRGHAHLHVVARPRYGPDDLVLADVQRTGGSWSHWFHKELLADPLSPPTGTWSPDLRNQASLVGRRANGAALFSHEIGQDRSLGGLLEDTNRLAVREADLLDLEVDEDGTLHLYCARGTHPDRDQRQVVIPAVVAGLVLRVADVAARISSRTGYVGTWDFAVALTGLRGAVPLGHRWPDTTAAYSRDDYRQSTSADTAELLATPRDCAQRLVGRLLRALNRDDGVDGIFATGA